MEVFVTRRIDYRRARILLREAVVDSIRRRRLPYPAVVVVVERTPGLVVFAGVLRGRLLIRAVLLRWHHDASSLLHLQRLHEDAFTGVVQTGGVPVRSYDVHAQTRIFDEEFWWWWHVALV